MLITVYILKFTNGTHYTGMTKNLQRRTDEHRRGKSKSTRHRGFFQIVWIGHFDGYRNARIIEIRIKKMSATGFLTKIKNDKSLIQL